MKRILVINGHPDSKGSFNSAIAQRYLHSAQVCGAELRYIAIGELDFNPNLQFGYQKRMELEPDLVNAMADIHWSEHQVWIHPIWWLGMPAVMKGFFDRAFLPGITFKSNKVGVSEGLLKNKTARIINTAGDLSLEHYEDVYKSSGLVQLQNGILEYCGVSSLSYTFFGPLDVKEEHDKKQFLETISVMAQDDVKAELQLK